RTTTARRPSPRGPIGSTTSAGAGFASIGRRRNDMNPMMINRRTLLARAGQGFGALALAGLPADQRPLPATTRSAAAPDPTPKAQAKRVAFLVLGGGPSQLAPFDPKPLLKKLDAKPVPDGIAKSVPKIARSRLSHLFASPYRFARQGQSGLEVSSLFPEVGRQ